MGAPARRPGARPRRAAAGASCRIAAPACKMSMVQRPLVGLGRNRPTERDCLTSSTRYSAFSVQVQSMGVCVAVWSVQGQGPWVCGVWMCVFIGCVFSVCAEWTNRDNFKGR